MKWLVVFQLAATIALGWIVLRRIGKVRRDLEEAEARLGRRLYRVQGRLAAMESEVAELEFDRKRARGEIRFTPEMTLGEAFSVHPRVREIFGSFGISGAGCAGGSLDESQSIREICRQSSVDGGMLLDSLRRFAHDPTETLGPPEPALAKLYQIGTIGAKAASPGPSEDA